MRVQDVIVRYVLVLKFCLEDVSVKHVPVLDALP